MRGGSSGRGNGSVAVYFVALHRGDGRSMSGRGGRESDGGSGNGSRSDAIQFAVLQGRDRNESDHRYVCIYMWWEDGSEIERGSGEWE